MTGDFFLIEDLIQILKAKNLITEIFSTSPNSFILAFDVWAKPGASVEKIFISKEGILIIQTRSRPIDGKANQSIIEAISDLMGIPKSQIEIFRGNKSRLKRIKIKVCFTANKKKSFYEKKFSAISNLEA